MIPSREAALFALALEKTASKPDKRGAVGGNRRGGDLGVVWRDWVFAQVLMREARALIEGDPKVGGEAKTSDSSALPKDPP